MPSPIGGNYVKRLAETSLVTGELSDPGWVSASAWPGYAEA
jgi:hypothetical protein